MASTPADISLAPLPDSGLGHRLDCDLARQAWALGEPTGRLAVSLGPTAK